jgi:hypothetical protein
MKNKLEGNSVQNNINVSDLAAGVYQLKITYGNEIPMQKKIIIL